MFSYAVLALAVVVAALVIHRFVTGTPPRRRALAVGTPVALLFLLCEIIYQLLGIVGAEDTELYDIVIWVFVAARAAVWYGFLFALIAAELFAARAMKRLVEQSLHHPSKQELEPMLREPLGDPQLRLQFLDRGDRDEVAIEPGPGRDVTVVQRDGTPAVAIEHDAQLNDDPELLNAAGAVALLAAENAQLDAGWKERAAGAPGIARRGSSEPATPNAARSSEPPRRRAAAADRDPDRPRARRRGRRDDAETRDRLHKIGGRRRGGAGGAARGGARALPADAGRLGPRRGARAHPRPRRRAAHLDADGISRHSPELETAVYYCCLEAIQNASKHGGPAVHDQGRPPPAGRRAQLPRHRQRPRLRSRPARMRAPASRTCRTGSARSTAACRSSPRPAGAPRSRGPSRCASGRWVQRRTMALPTSTPIPIEMKVIRELTKWSSPAARLEPTNSAMPIRPTAPGTSSQNAGRNVASDGGPDGRVATQAATGVTISAPKNPPRVSETRRPPTCWPIQAAKQHDEKPAERARRSGEVHEGADAEHDHAEPRRPVAKRVLGLVGDRLVERDAGDQCAGGDAEAEQDELHRPGHQAARAADHLAGREVERRGGEQAARDEGHERGDQDAHRAVDRLVGRDPERERADERGRGDREQHADGLQVVRVDLQRADQGAEEGRGPSASGVGCRISARPSVSTMWPPITPTVPKRWRIAAISSSRRRPSSGSIAARSASRASVSTAAVLVEAVGREPQVRQLECRRRAATARGQDHVRQHRHARVRHVVGSGDPLHPRLVERDRLTRVVERPGQFEHELDGELGPGGRHRRGNLTARRCRYITHFR